MKAIAYRHRMQSPLGTMLLVAANDGLAIVDFEDSRNAPLACPDWHEGGHHPLLKRAQAQLAEYFAGQRAVFDLPLAPAGTAFQQAVWTAIRTVPAGATISYRELAQRAGRPDSVRAAGAATGRNPLAIIIPCHRIIGSNGTLTGYAGGLDRKRALLALEAKFAPRPLLAQPAPGEERANRSRTPLADAA